MNINEIKTLNTPKSGSSILGGVASTIASGASSVLNAVMMRKQQKFAAAEAQKQRDWEERMTRLQMDYNSPSNQLAMMRGAGMNIQDSGDSISPMSPSVGSGAAAAPPATPQMAISSGISDIAQLLGAYSQLQNSNVNLGNLSISDYLKDPQKWQMLANTNLADSQAVTNDYMRPYLGMQIRETIRDTRAAALSKEISNTWLTPTYAAQLHLTQTQADVMVKNLAMQYANIENQLLMSRIAASASMYGADKSLEGTKYSAGKAYDSAVHAAHLSFISSMQANKINRQAIDDAWNKFKVEQISTHLNPYKIDWAHDLNSFLGYSFGNVGFNGKFTIGSILQNRK